MGGENSWQCFRTADYPPPGCIDRLTHEYGLREYLQREWAVRPVELRGDRGRPVLLLKPPRALPLDRLICQTMEDRTFLAARGDMAIFEAGFRFEGLGHELVERKGLRQFEALACLTFAIVIP